MSERVLITGGAGFVGSHLADQLLQQGYQVRVLDSLIEQVHGESGLPDYLNPRVELIRGDVRDEALVGSSLKDVSAVYHFAAAVGVGQSMYQVSHYTGVNNLGTAVLLEALMKSHVSKVVVASSMSLYGEGLYVDPAGNQVAPPERRADDLRLSRWELRNEQGELAPIATPETKTPAPSSVYALSKYDQERLCMIVGNAYNIPVTALRFFNIYGPRQALSNPYTGVLAIFSSRYLNYRPPIIFEDGQQRRDFVSVHDIARACVLALENDRANGEVFNVGSGSHYSVADIASKVGQVLGRDLEPEITGEYRVGDIRHCFADISKARDLLGFKPAVSLEDGLEELAEWLQGQRSFDRVDAMRGELTSRGLSL